MHGALGLSSSLQNCPIMYIMSSNVGGAKPALAAPSPVTTCQGDLREIDHS